MSYDCENPFPTVTILEVLLCNVDGVDINYVVCEPAFCFSDLKIVAAHHALAHSTIRNICPILSKYARSKCDSPQDV
jgi:hypothetical protein